MAKSAKKQVKNKELIKKKDITFNLSINKSAVLIILGVLLTASFILPYYYINYAHSLNQYHSFPLDDPWIHLQFAKNLAEYGSFSYFKNEIVTAGSTSPLYTLILAAGFFVTKNEMWLSYITGIIFFICAVYYFYRLSSSIFPNENWLALAAVMLFVLDKWMNFISVTGMETTLYIFLLVACFYYYRKLNAAGFAVTLALSMWTRPDAVAFIAAIAADYLYRLYIRSKSKNKDNLPEIFSRDALIKIAVISGIIMAAYFIMNLVISGSLLPNTYSAKLTYYSAEFRSRGDFLKSEVWEYFTEKAYLLILIPFLIAAFKIINDSVKQKYNPLLPALIFILLLIFIYWYKLPYAHRFGRYLMPVFPFYFLLAVYGGREFFKWLAEYINDSKLVNGLNIMLLLGTMVYFTAGYNENKRVFQDQSRHIYIRQVEAAKWLKNNTPDNSVIATHDVGAIAYYSERKIVDVVGLINPEFVEKLNNKDFVTFVKEQLKKQNVSYVAFLKEWFQVANQPSLFSAGENNFEIMNIYKYEPDKTHILSTEVNTGMNYAAEFIKNKQYPNAVTILKQVISFDPQNSLAYFQLAYAYSELNDVVNSEKSLRKAVEIYPGYRDAAISLSNLYRIQNRIDESKNVLNSYIAVNPQDTAVISQLKQLNSMTTSPDSLKNR